MSLLAIIVAMDSRRLIGRDNGLPWRLPDDMKWFVEKTMGKPVIMGRKTYESIPPKFRPLAGRHNIILTRNSAYTTPGCTIVHSAAAALTAAGEVPEIIIGGGSQIYTLFLPQTGRLYLTEVQGTFAGDAYFPAIDETRWQETFRRQHVVDGRHPIPFTWRILDRK